MSRNTAKKLQRKCGYCYRRACRDEQQGVEQCDICKLQDWLRNYHLAHCDAYNLFNEFLEMGKLAPRGRWGSHDQSKWRARKRWNLFLEISQEKRLKNHF